MTGELIKKIQSRRKQDKKQIAVLIDPESSNTQDIIQLVRLSEDVGVDYFFVGGSTANHEDMDAALTTLKEISDIPTLIFPGSVQQLNNKADGLLYLSLISGRNPELLIGKHVESVPFLRKSNLEVIPTAYLLIDGGKESTVAYISNTTPIPAEKPDITVATALAGQYLGMQLIYLEAGSGAKNAVAASTITAVRQSTSVPLIVGGGIRTPEKAAIAAEAGADIIVIGNILEKDPNMITDLSIAVHTANTKSIV